MGDYYTVLQCDKTASAEELKRSYQRLLLSSHPDKNDDDSDEKFLLIQKAWSVLREPESRKQYDATLTCQEHTEVLLYDTVSLSDMTLASEDIYTYSCRCGGTYKLENSEAIQKNIYIGCDECSFSILVKR
ncbi:putative CSL-type zinc finger domain-containing protein [Operophtera brumata]|uniref:Putative CSL-type zinc finger domain-containing protein n=1 Tax=Operophtera brumata TaxID=104452 RepID=A0A0L7LEX0_OPEBR|nr:putative CSL-type zinc finger domain-containing protein [Operophtera brumata]